MDVHVDVDVDVDVVCGTKSEDKIELLKHGFGRGRLVRRLVRWWEYEGVRRWCYARVISDGWCR